MARNQPLRFIGSTIVDPIMGIKPVAHMAVDADEAPDPTGANGGASAVNYNRYASVKSFSLGALNVSILVGNIILAINLSYKNDDDPVEMFKVTTAFLCMSIGFEFINLMLAIALAFFFTESTEKSKWATFLAMVLAVVGAIMNSVASYLVTQAAPDLVSALKNETSV